MLQEKPSSLFMLSEWSTVSVTSLMMCVDFLARILLSGNWMWHPKFMPH